MYLAMINNGFVDTNRKMWKVGISLKIKIFMWYVYKGIVLTKDNLAKHNWDESKQCSFCCRDESIQHLFFDCFYARFVWGLLHITFGIRPPLNTNHLFGTWSNSLSGSFKRQLLATAWLSVGQFGLVELVEAVSRHFHRCCYRSSTLWFFCWRGLWSLGR
jgi:hypothetical protein